MPTDTLPDATDPAPDIAVAVDETFAAAESERLPYPPRVRRFRSEIPKQLRRPLRRLDREASRAVSRIAATPTRRRRVSIAGALILNAAMLAILAIYGRVHIFVPNKPAESISVVFVDLPASPPVVDLRDPEIAPEPEPEPVKPELIPEPEPDPVPEPPKEAEPEPAPEPEPEKEPAIDLTPEPVFAPPSEVEDAPFIPDEAPTPPTPTLEEPLPGDIEVAGDQTPAEEAPPLVAVEPEARQAEEDAGKEEEDEEKTGAGEVAAGEDATVEQAPVVAAEPAETKVGGDDAFDEEPVFNGRRMALPQVELPKGETSAIPGTSGVVAIYCPEEFSDKDKIAECAGRPEIRSGWRPGSSGEDFSKAASILRERRKHGDFSNDDVTFGPELARQAEERGKIEDLKDARKEHDLDNVGLAPEPAGRPDQLVPPIAQPSWTRRDDPLVDEGDVEKLRRELEEAEKQKSPQ